MPKANITPFELEELLKGLRKALNETRKDSEELFKQLLKGGPSIFKGEEWAEYNLNIFKYLISILDDPGKAKQTYAKALGAILKMRFNIDQVLVSRQSWSAYFIEFVDPNFFEQVKNAGQQLEKLDEALDALEKLRIRIEEIEKKLKTIKLKPGTHNKKSPTKPGIKSKLYKAFHNLVVAVAHMVDYMAHNKTASLTKAKYYINEAAAILETLKGKIKNITTPLFHRKGRHTAEKHTAQNKKSHLNPKPRKV